MFAIGVLPITPFPQDDEAELEGAEEIAALINKPIVATKALLTRGRVPGAFKFAGRWHLRPSVWRKWRDEQEAASIARASKRPQPIRVHAPRAPTLSQQSRCSRRIGRRALGARRKSNRLTKKGRPARGIAGRGIYLLGMTVMV